MNNDKVATPWHLIFRRFAHHLSDPKRVMIAQATDPGFKRLNQITEALKEYAAKALGGAVLVGDNWKEESGKVE